MIRRLVRVDEMERMNLDLVIAHPWMSHATSAPLDSEAASKLADITAEDAFIKRAKSLHAGEIFKRVADNAKSDIAKQLSRGVRTLEG
jgi:hypothetical protein